MNLSYRIAIRYFFSRNKRSFISVIARIAMAGVAVGTMAMVVVLSVFNGMEDLNRKMFKTFDADVTITPAEGKRFMVSDTLLKSIKSVEGVSIITQVIEDNALARYGNQQTIVRLKGVDSTFSKAWTTGYCFDRRFIKTLRAWWNALCCHIGRCQECIVHFTGRYYNASGIMVSQNWNKNAECYFNRSISTRQ